MDSIYWRDVKWNCNDDVNAFFALYLKDKVDSLLEVGVIMALSPIAASFGSLIGGIADIYGRKPIMIFSMASNALLMLGFLFIEGFIPYAILSIF